MVDKVLAKISTRIYLEHQTNNIRAVILYTLIGFIIVIILFILQLAMRLQRVAAVKKGCTIYFQHKLESTLYDLEPSNLRRVAKLYDLKNEMGSVTPKQKRPEIVDKILSTDHR